jgi:SAM-dependent methyltransferase
MPNDEMTTSIGGGAFRETPPAAGFTAHNIRLDDGTQTCPDRGWTMDQSGILRSVRHILNLIYPAGLAGKSIVDIGCLEGGFATEFARLGLHATGIEVRDSNYQNCLRVKAGTNLRNLRFIKDDANNIGNYDPFDAVFVCGLLYHLDWPRRFLTAASKVCRRVIFLETHVASDLEVPANRLYHLSDVTEHEGLRGRWFREYDRTPDMQLDQMKWASWSNSYSFWIQKEHLVQLLRNLGFDIVLEQFDCDDNIIDQQTGWRRNHSRLMLVGIRV